MDRLLRLDNKVALVTGAGQGVGRQIALHLAEYGCAAVVVNDFFGDRAEAVANEVRSLGAKAIVLVGDVTDLPTFSPLLEAAVQEAGGLQLVVNNAGNAGPLGVADDKPFWETDPSDWNKWLGTNLFGVLNVCRIAIPLMLKSGSGGSLVNIISDAGRVGEPNLAVYSAAKAGVAGLSRALAKALGTHAIRVNSVSLASILTPATSDVLGDEALVRKMLRQYIVRRLGTPDDVANMVLFLCSDASSWISGQTVSVNGGYVLSL